MRPGPTRDAILSFLDDLDHVPVDERVAYLDNDGTMWCEKPTYVQLDFFIDALQQRVDVDPSLGERPEFAAVLAGDMAAVGEIGLAKVAGALAALFDGQTPDEFAAAVAGRSADGGRATSVTTIGAWSVMTSSSSGPVLQG